MNKDIIGAIIPARVSSKRLPNKMILPLMKIPSIKFLIRRIKQSKKLDKIILATSTNSEDDILEQYAKDENINVYRGGLEDVAKRVIDAANTFRVSKIVRIMGDCPFINHKFIDYNIKKSEILNFDLYTTKGKFFESFNDNLHGQNFINKNKYFPEGIDLEIFEKAGLVNIYSEKNFSYRHKEHVTLYFFENLKKYKIYVPNAPLNWTNDKEKFIIDDINDYKKAEEILKKFKSIYFSLEKILTS